jgi:PAS domain S-box-containing protein
MNKQPLSSTNPLTSGAFKIAGIYLLIGILWILFSDRLAERIALNKEMLANLSLYKGWAYVIVTAVLLYWLVQRQIGKLHASQMQLQVVINALPVLISYIDQNQRYQFANEAYEEWFGEKAQGKHIEEVVGQTIYQKTSKYIDRVLRGETVTYETEILDRAGEERFVNATYVPDLAANGHVKGFFTLVHDISEQKEAREKLRQWADAFEGCAHGIAIGDPDTNRIVVCNPAFANMHKCRVEEIVGTSILSLYSPSDHDHVRHNIERADQIGHVGFEAQMTRKGGDKAVFPVEMDLVSILDEGGELIYRVVTAQDISERRLIDEKLRESETKYRTLAEHLPVVTYISGPDQHIGVSYISPQIESFGFDSKEWLAHPEFWFRHIHPEDREKVEAELRKFQAGAELFRAEYRLILPNRETRWFHDESIRVKDQNAKTLLKQGFMLDITERKRAEEVLYESEERYRIVSELTSDYAYKDRVEPDGSIVPEWITESFTRITGYTLEETYAPGFWQQLAHPEDIQILLGHIQAILSGQAHTMEVRVITKSGQVRWLRDYSNPIWDADQERVTGLYGAVQDITEYKQAEEKLLLQAHWLDQINDAVITSDLNLMITTWNPAAERTYGWKAEEVIGKKGEEILKTEFFSKTRSEAQQELRESGKFSAEITQLRKDGSRIQIETRTVTLRDKGGHIIGQVSVNRDITERRQTEEKLRKSEERYRYLFENNPYPMWTYDRKTLAFLDVNEAAVAKYGYSRQEFLNMTIADIRPTEDVERLMSNLAQPRQPLEHSDGWRHRLKDGVIIHVEITSHTVEIDGHESALVVAQDITERKRAEEQLERSNHILNEILMSIQDDFYVLNHDWNFVYASQLFTSKVGKEPGDFIGNNIWQMFPKHLGTVLEENFREAMEKREVRRFELGGKYTAAWYRMTVFPSAEGITVLGTDITERKKIADDLQKAHDELEVKVQERTAALSQANALLQALMDTMPDQIYFKDTQCRFIRNSRAQVSLLGLSDPVEVIGKTDFDFFPHAAKAFAEEQEVMKTGKSLIDFEEWVVWPDGKESWVSTTKVPLRNSSGETIGIFGISRDITERKRSELAIQQLNRDLEKQAEKLQVANKELEAFSYSVSHDLRAPLRAIDGYTRILVEDYESKFDAEGKRICGVISAEARRMGQLIDDLLAFSRLGRKEMYSSNVDMKALVVSVLNELVKDDDRERIDFKIARLHSMSADASLMRQVWVNLLSNALKFTSKKEQATIEVGSKSNKEEIIYFVRDTGAGFDMEYANKLFGVFQRLHSESEFEGTGVGLAIVQRIIHRHEGRVWAEGQVDQGATFYFALPRKEEHHE